MRVQRFSDPRAFYDEVSAYLLADEAAHNLLLGILSGALEGSETAYLAAVRGGGALVGVALRTPGRHLLLSRFRDPAGPLALCEDLEGDPLPGVIGPAREAEGFARGWHERTGSAVRLEMAQRIYQLEAVRPVTGVAGRLRPAREADKPLLATWLADFNEEALGERDERHAAHIAETALSSEARGFYFWEDGQPVSLAGFSGPTPNGIRVSAVYTPPEHRRRGYASACVAALSQRLLEGGRRFVFLFTNLSNRTSNRIYREIGYTPVCDVNMIRFSAV